MINDNKPKRFLFPIFFSVFIIAFACLYCFSHKPDCANNFCYNPTVGVEFEDLINGYIPMRQIGIYDNPVVWRDCTDLFPINSFPEDFFNGLEEIDWSIRYTVVSLKGGKLGYVFCRYTPERNIEYHEFAIIEYPSMREYIVDENVESLADSFISIIYPQDKPELIMRRFHFLQTRMFLR